MDSPSQLILRPEIEIPELPRFSPLPAVDPEFSEVIAGFVRETRLDEMCPAARNPDKYDEWSSVCVADLSDLAAPLVGGWKEQNFIYPAGAYFQYIVGECVRQIIEGEFAFETALTIKEHNIRHDPVLGAGQQITVAEALRLACHIPDAAAANEIIDLVDRERASALMRALGCAGSDITRKFLPREFEDAAYQFSPGTYSCALHFVTFLWAVETGAIGGGRGRALIKAILAQGPLADLRFRSGLPDSASLYGKSGEWGTFTSEAAIVEQGPLRYAIAVLAPIPTEVGSPRLAHFARLVHEHLGERVASRAVGSGR